VFERLAGLQCDDVMGTDGVDSGGRCGEIVDQR